MEHLLNDELITQLKHCDFFAGNSEDFYAKVKKVSVLVNGAHKEPAPLVSILITTYKRPQWLKITLESALNQEGFDDYEIIVVDNEGESLDVETETSRLVQSYNDKKIVYYRNIPPSRPKFDTAVSLSRSKYFCIVHDDDFLSGRHLKCLTDILNERPDISYAACTHQSFDTKDEAACLEQSREGGGLSPRVVYYPAKSACAGCWPGWLGALIDRERFIGIGGMSLPVPVGITDLIMVMRYMDRYDNVYHVRTKQPLYYYRVSDSQESATGTGMWLRFFVSEYLFHRWLARRYHPSCTFLWNYLASIIVHDKIRKFERQKIWRKGGFIDAAALERLAGLSAYNSNRLLLWAGKRILSLVRWRYIKK